MQAASITPEPIGSFSAFTTAGENKSAVLTRLMRQAIAERHRERIRTAAIEAMLELRKAQPAVADSEIARARQEGRP